MELVCTNILQYRKIIHTTKKLGLFLVPENNLYKICSVRYKKFMSLQQIT